VVNLDEQNNIIRKLVFRLVRKHIAGPTSGSVLNAVKDLNNKGLHATVTLLNDHVEDQSKAKYNTNAYVQSIRQLSRLNLNSDVSIRLSQIGYGIDDSMLERNIQSIIGIANSCKQRLWLENEPMMGDSEAMSLYKKYRQSCERLGVEVRTGNAREMSRMVSKNDMIKLIAPFRERGNEKQAAKGDIIRLYKESIEALMGKRASLTILEDDPKIINRIIAINKDYKRNLIFEIPLGYGRRKLNALQKSRVNLSVYVPYGKDWIPYFINRLAEGRVRNIAVALLNGERSSVGANVKEEGAKAG
jgi:proline dehydrogenase